MRPSDAYMRRQTNHHWLKNGLSPWWRQAIICTNDGIVDILIQSHIFFIHENPFQNVVWQMEAILC